MKKHWNISVKGKVQGVYYRASTRVKALELGLTGFVLNRPDGSVYIEAEGSPEALQHLADWCRQGPKHARVDLVSAVEGDLINFNTFEIKGHP